MKLPSEAEKDFSLQLIGASRLDHLAFSIGAFILLVALVVLLWFFVPELMTRHLPQVTERGAFGDSYGAVTSLFTGLAFAGLVFTLLLQNREIKLQRADFYAQIDELRLTRSEVMKQSAIQEKQLFQAIVQLKMRALEVEVEYIKMDSLKWVEGARSERSGSELLLIKEEMEKLVKQVESYGVTALPGN